MKTLVDTGIRYGRLGVSGYEMYPEYFFAYAANYIRSLLSMHGVFGDVGSLTIWGTCFMMGDAEPYSEGASAVLQSVSTSNIVLKRRDIITDRSYTNVHCVKDERLESKIRWK